MKQSAVELKNRNNRRDRMLSMENKEWMTKIVCYLRTRSVEEKNWRILGRTLRICYWRHRTEGKVQTRCWVEIISSFVMRLWIVWENMKKM